MAGDIAQGKLGFTALSIVMLTGQLTKRSLTAYVAIIENSPVFWKTKKQNVVSHFLAEAEYQAMYIATREITWLRQVLTDLGFCPRKSSRLFCDSNKSHALSFFQKKKATCIIHML